MPKRSNPWSDGPQQMKTHVGQIEVAHGVDGKGILDKIHQNTRKLLVEGAKKFYNETICDEDSCMIIVEAGFNNNIDRSGKQREIDSYFGGNISKKKTVEVTIHPKAQHCRICPSTEVVICCSFCESPSCISCMRTCSQCLKDFCALCAVASYSGPIDQAYCLNCNI